MSRLAVAARSARALRIFILTIAVLWTAVVGASLLWGAAAVRRNTFEQAQLRASLAGAGESSSGQALEAAVARYDRLITAGHVALWLAGLGFVGIGGRWLLQVDREREAAEKSLLREQETLRLLYENSPDAVAVIDRARRLIYANRLVEESAGAGLEALQGRICHEAMNGDTSPCGDCPVEEVFRDGRQAGRVKRNVAADGTEEWLWQQWYPVRGAGGAIESVVEIARDVSDLKRAEAELERYAASLAEANRLKDLFTDIMSHDLLNPAAASRYFLEQLKEKEADPRRLRLIDTIEHNLYRLIEMIQNASLYSRLKEKRESSAQVMDLGEVVRGVLEDLEPNLAAAAMAVNGPAPGSYPACVHPMFANVVFNLVGNAVKYAASGRRIAVGIESAGSEWVLSVCDWGEGIPAAGKASLFTRYERLGKDAVQGTGLGLAIARRIVELHGGSIWIEDNPEGGTIFRVRVRGAAVGACQAGSSL